MCRRSSENKSLHVRKGTFTHAQAEAGGKLASTQIITRVHTCAVAERRRSGSKIRSARNGSNIQFAASASKPRAPNHHCPQEMADPPASAPRMCEHTRGSGAGMSKSARLHSATAPRMCERSLNGNKCRYKSRRNPPPLIEHLAPVSLWASYVHTCAGRLRSGGGRILTFPLRYRGYVHTYAERTRAELPFLEDNDDGLERAVLKRTRQIGCWTHFLRSGFCSRSASAPRPRMCEHM